MKCVSYSPDPVFNRKLHHPNLLKIVGKRKASSLVRYSAFNFLLWY